MVWPILCHCEDEKNERIESHIIMRCAIAHLIRGQRRGASKETEGDLDVGSWEGDFGTAGERG